MKPGELPAPEEIRPMPDDVMNWEKDDTRMAVMRREYEYEISGDTAVNVTTPTGDYYSIRYVGIGHPWHTIGPDGGRGSTDAEYALAQALIHGERA